MKKIRFNLKGFTFIELVIVITILSILFSIGFVGFTSYLVGTRDANRLSQVNSLNNGIRIYGTKEQLPLPEKSIQIILTGSVIAYQGYIGEIILSLINFEEGGLDPKDKKHFSYYITKNRKYFQILSFLEDENSSLNNISLNLIDNTSAKLIDYSNRSILVYGDKLGILTEYNTNKPIHEIDDIIGSGYLDIGLTTDYYTTTLLNNDSIIGTGSILSKLGEVAIYGGKGCTTKTGIISCTGEAGGGTLIGGGGGGSGGGTSTIENFKLESYNGGRRWNDGNLAINCNKYKNPIFGYEYTGYTGNGIYWIEPTSGIYFKVYCDMTIDNGGWTLLFNRKADNDNEESCGANLNEFLQNTCGNLNNIGELNSYSIGRTNRLLISQTEYLVSQSLVGVLDSDDAYIMRYNGDLFPDSIGVMNNILIDRVCDIDSLNCDTTDVYWKYIGNGYYWNARCNSAYDNNIIGARGNYSLCHNGVSTDYYSSSFLGNRNQYNEAKLWGHYNYEGRDYQERIFIR